MNRPRYKAYRDSGISWLGEVPKHWDTVALRWSSMRYAGGTPDRAKEEYWEDGTIPWINSGAVNQRLVTEPSAHITKAGFQGSSTKWIPSGALVMALAGQGRTKGMVAQLAIKTTCNQSMAAIVPGDRFIPRYLYFLLDTQYDVLRNLAGGEQRDGLNLEIVGSLQCLVPPLDEQRAIAAFLDRETARIDTLIEKKQLLIERLEEQRTALISRTVTRGLPPEAARAAGLDPSPRLKGSGVEWLGDVPEHWEVVRNRWLFDERDERSDDGGGELLTVSHITGVTRRSEKPDVGMFMAETLEGYKRCCPGDLVINTMWAWMGAAGVAWEAGVVSPSYNVYRPNERLLSGFADLLFRSRRYVVGVTSESRGIWTSRLRLYPDQFMSLVTAVPPLEEQEAIIRHVEQIGLQSHAKKAAIETAIERLREYRAALVTAAVTGKIDLRQSAPVLASGG